MTASAALEALSGRKARGAFFTPVEIARFIATWAIRSPHDRIFEPSCGEAVFMLEAARRLRALGAEGRLEGQLIGAEFHVRSAIAAMDLLIEEGIASRIALGDFFDFPFRGDREAVIGNPPYVRFQDFTGESRLRAREAALAEGVALTGLASSWAAFVVQSAALVKLEGRLGLVLPAELLSVNYAAPVRRYLMERFGRVRLVMFEERVFPGVLAEVVLLLAEGTGPTDKIEICQVQNLGGLRDDLRAVRWSPSEPEEKWTPALVPEAAFATYAGLLQDGEFVELRKWGSTSLGMVTGNNRFFALSPTQVREFRIPGRELLPISPPGSRHLRGLTFSQAAWDELAEEDRRVYLFLPSRERPGAASKRYIAEGEEQNTHAAYKCRVRSPWWRVPTVGAPDLFLTYMNHDTPRLVTNDAGVSYLNSIHGVTLKRTARKLGRELLPVAALNSATILGAELVGRSYGGGLLKVEPNEADLLPVPARSTIQKVADDLRSVAPHVARELRKGDLDTAAKMVDDVLLVRGLGMKRADVRAMGKAREALFARRAARAGKSL